MGPGGGWTLVSILRTDVVQFKVRLSKKLCGNRKKTWKLSSTLLKEFCVLSFQVNFNAKMIMLILNFKNLDVVSQFRQTRCETELKGNCTLELAHAFVTPLRYL